MEAVLETMHREIDEIKTNVDRILFILENEGEVKETVLKELEARRESPRKEFISHEEVKKALVE